MKYVESPYFLNQLKKLSKRYLCIFDDYTYFKRNFSWKYDAISLYGYLYKTRIRNSSIPVWKSWGFRIILFMKDEKIVPLLIYSKTQKENVTKEEIKIALQTVFDEL